MISLKIFNRQTDPSPESQSAHQIRNDSVSLLKERRENNARYDSELLYISIILLLLKIN